MCSARGAAHTAYPRWRLLVCVCHNVIVRCWSAVSAEVEMLLLLLPLLLCVFVVNFVGGGGGGGVVASCGCCG